MAPGWYLVGPLGWTQVRGWTLEMVDSLWSRGLMVVEVSEEDTFCGQATRVG